MSETLQRKKHTSSSRQSVGGTVLSGQMSFHQCVRRGRRNGRSSRHTVAFDRYFCLIGFVHCTNSQDVVVSPHTHRVVVAVCLRIAVPLLWSGRRKLQQPSSHMISKRHHLFTPVCFHCSSAARQCEVATFPPSCVDVIFNLRGFHRALS